MKGPNNAKRRLAFRKVVALVALLGLEAISPHVGRLAASDGELELSVTAGFTDKPIASRETIELLLNRIPSPQDGRLAVLIGQTDVSSLLVKRETHLVYVPKIFPLPPGDTEVRVYLVSPQNLWSQIASFTLHVQNDAAPAQPPASAPQAASTQSSNATNSATRKGYFDRAGITPGFTIGMKSQAAESHFPDSSRPPRPEFADLTLQGSLRSEAARGGFNAQTQFDMVGSSFQQEALRFASEGNRAPNVDLSSYLMQFQMGKAKVNLGSVSFGTNRFLMNSFSSRGISLTTPLTHRVDAGFAAVNGTSVVGWSNFFGLANRDHQVIAGTLGFELMKRPGGLRLETNLIDGSLLPLSSFNQGNINDAERSRGIGLRLLGSAADQRWRIDAGFARSAFTNPSDPLLAQGQTLVAVRSATRNAHYFDASYNIVQNRSLTETKKANLTVNIKHERVAPLFRSIAASTQADREQDEVDLVAQLGDVTATASHVRFQDNLANIPSILKTLSQHTNFILGVPLGSLFGPANQPSPWLPRVSYTVDETHQFANQIPVNGGFESNPSAVPNQLSTNQSATADWQFKQIKIGYRWNRSYQDNRQVGREQADFKNLINGVSLGISPSQKLSLNLDLSNENAFNKEARRSDNTFRIGPNINWQITKNMTLTALASFTRVGANTRVIDNRSAEVDAQWSYRWSFEKSKFRKVQAQLFIRYANRYTHNQDFLFNLNNQIKLQTLNTGLSFTFF